MLRNALSRASAAFPVAAGAFAATRAFATAPAVTGGWAEVANFEKSKGEATRQSMAKMFTDLKMEVPAAIKEGRPVGELVDSVNDAFLAELDLPKEKLRDVYSLRAKIRESFARQETEIVPAYQEIDWEGYKAALGDGALVDKFKASLEKALADPALKTAPAVDGPDPLLETVAEAEKALDALMTSVTADMKDSETKLAELKKRNTAIESEIAAIEKGTVTLDDELARYPDLAEKIDADILNDKW